MTTIPPDLPTERQRRNATLRRIGIGLLFVFVALASQLGVRTGNAESVAGEFGAMVAYPTVGRRGLATPLVVHIDAPTLSEVTMWINSSYLGLLDHNSWVPEPSEILTRGTETGLKYEPVTEVFEIRLDTRFAPSVTPGRYALDITIEAESESIDFQLATWVVP